ncbi:MAG: CRISPR-associated endonuclease Cas2 [Tissierellia bacterium]|nr:CRISPR-associated endonuclease Cas2 [Tissierellia bacterium]
MNDLFVTKTGKSEEGGRFLTLIIYDIVDNPSRVRFSKFLQSYGVRVQKSCFEAYLTNSQIHKLLKSLGRRINKKEDNVRIYVLTAHGKVYNFGLCDEPFYEDVVII